MGLVGEHSSQAASCERLARDDPRGQQAGLERSPEQLARGCAPAQAGRGTLLQWAQNG